MTIISSDGERFVSVGSAALWWSLYSTMLARIDRFVERYEALNTFFKSQECASESALQIAEQLEVIKQSLSAIRPELAVYDINHPEVLPPWTEYINPAVSSCAELYTTEDGLNLMDELIGLLKYAGSTGTVIKPAM